MGEEVEVYKAFPQNVEIHIVISLFKAFGGKNFSVPEEDYGRDWGIELEASVETELLQVWEWGEEY